MNSESEVGRQITYYRVQCVELTAGHVSRFRGLRSSTLLTSISYLHTEYDFELMMMAHLSNASQGFYSPRVGNSSVKIA